jgi:CubicO group peptidase (beta-lactamase class C family)
MGAMGGGEAGRSRAVRMTRFSFHEIGDRVPLRSVQPAGEVTTSRRRAVAMGSGGWDGHPPASPQSAYTTGIMPTRRLLCLGVAAAFATYGLVACAGDEAVQAYVAEQLRDQQIPGLSVAVLRDGQVVLARGYGLASVELNVPATAGTVYRLASVTKPLTATAVLQLVEEGRLALDGTLPSYLAETPPAWTGITVRQLLTHTSGLKDYLNELRLTTRDGTTPEEILGALGRLPLNFPPGSQARYSNTNFLVLGVILQQVSGLDYEALLTQRVFAPIGMRHTRLNRPEAVMADRSAGYVSVAGELRNSPRLEPSLYDNADAGLVSSVEDLARWLQALRANRLLSAATQRAMWTPVTLPDGTAAPFGLGWSVTHANGHRLVYHRGNRPDGSGFVARYVDDGIDVVVLTNLGDANAAQIAAHIAGLYLPALMPGAEAPIPDDGSGVTGRLRDVLLAIQNGTIEADPFAPEMWDQLQTGPLDYVRSLLAPAAALESLTLLRREEADDLSRSQYRVVFERRVFIVDCGVDRDGRIHEMGIRQE